MNFCYPRLKSRVSRKLILERLAYPRSKECGFSPRQYKTFICIYLFPIELATTSIRIKVGL